jgi:hypothetical protein
MKKKRNNIFCLKIKFKSQSENIKNIISIFIGQSFIWRKKLNIVFKSLSHIKFTNKQKQSRRNLF